MNPLPLTAYTATSCLGAGIDAHALALREGRSGLQPCRFETVDLSTWVGEVAGVDDVALPDAWREFDCRNNRLTWLGLQQDGFAERVREAVARHGADRVGVFMGTSTSGILQTELAYRRRDPATGALPDDFNYAGTHNTYSVAAFVRACFGIEGMAMALSSACSSSAKAFAAAARQIRAGAIDAAVVGGVDSLCLTTLYGFASLQLTSAQPCRPGDAQRDGISIGEAAAFALLERGPAQAGDIVLRGAGESSDAHHMSAPHPQGLGALQAMQAALRSAGVSADDIGYINLHGTATPANDAAEGLAVAELFAQRVPASSTKGATGHTLGAAGALEAVVCALALRDGWLPGSPGTLTPDPAIQVDYRLGGSAAPGLQLALSNSFGFGGSNCSLVFGRSA
ncbi:MAG: beta-ketoacyl-[acyl-carrier-protein] synthase family protein [Hydrogenophaga sp.]|uniref:beta-ketoacyl-[acyl-carrier-protein] synthase family protein n=1 Tax=Hydrogenophaga sp. TaxID=1904254 RepID=UPI001DFD2440|nr:beta-ketoacyl-[acyl-carrier-protein] synthase family protein [Hydrogenophaga sp.]MBX3609925.1 beta-ketoacyl-[acyl-carrier-protein] synthase family protein [Hydrogenophaga sp.]